MGLDVCVFCSSSEVVDPVFGDLGESVGRRLAAAGHRLVYGGTAIGTMGRLADGARAGGAEVIGIVPRVFVERGLTDAAATELVVTDGLMARKQVMVERSQAFLVLPGGLGTLDELFEVLTLRQLGYHDRPIVLLDAPGEAAGFWRPLLDLFARLVETGFLHQRGHDLVRLADDVGGALEMIAAGGGPQRSSGGSV